MCRYGGVDGGPGRRRRDEAAAARAEVLVFGLGLVGALLVAGHVGLQVTHQIGPAREEVLVGHEHEVELFTHARTHAHTVIDKR